MKDFSVLITSAILFLILPSTQLLLLASQDNLVLGVETSSNVSQSSDSEDPLIDHPANVGRTVSKEENMVEEIHSSFDDMSVMREEQKNKAPLSAATINIQHQHANIATELSESGQAAVVYTLVDSATAELQRQAAASENRTDTVTIPLALSDSPANESQYTVRPAEHQETHVEPEPDVAPAPLVESELGEESNDTHPAVQTPTEPPSPQEDIPSFSEWAQKQLAEAEKKKGENITGGGPVPAMQMKVRHSKNYASPDCGAKVVGANPEAVSAGSVLSSSRDEYLLNTCNARIWFIVELCEAIQPKKIEMANFELFSSSPKEFSVWLSDRYPTRDWALAGRFTAQDERNVQAFNLTHSSHFGKYVKVELHSHYGQEHYCPVSLFRVYGTSEIEVLDTVDEGHHQPAVEEDDDELLAGEGGEAPRNLFGSARDAVLSIVKKAAEALAKGPEEGRGNHTDFVTNQTEPQTEPCITPSHIVVCVNCSDNFYNQVFHLMSCRTRLLGGLLSSKLVSSAVAGSELCAERGLDLRVGAPYPPRPRPGGRPRPLDYLQALLPPQTLTALCNLLAVAQKKVVLNVSSEPVSVNNDTMLDASTEEATPILPSTTGELTAESEASASGETLATRPPHEAPHSSPLPIRPSRTVADDSEPSNATVLTEPVDVVVDSIDTPPVENNETSNQSLPVEKPSVPEEASTQAPLVTEDSGSLDSLFSELEMAVVPSPRAPPAPQKESVFVRLANRIKALERNMSLSGQYLEELSRRYKRQVEEMQRALAAAGEERRRGEQREGLRLEQVTQLTQRVEALTMAVNGLLEERDSWQHKATVMGQHAVIVVVEVIVFAAVLLACRWLPDVQVSRRKISMAWPRGAQQPTRRKSTDELQPLAKRRRPSEEALVIAGSTHQELLIPEERRKVSKGETRRQRRKRRRELAAQTQTDALPGPSLALLDDATESVAAWWEEEVFAPVVNTAPPRNDVVVTAAPRFVQTAVAQRQDRIARSSESDKGSKTFLPIKKTGPFKKIVKKFF